MIQVKEYMCDGRIPSDKEIEEAISVASTEDCVVRLLWVYPYSGNYEVLIYPETPVEEVKRQLPKKYCV